MAACTQPGCTGTIVDGYCDVCGSPAGAASFVSAAPAASPTSPFPVDELGSTAARPGSDRVKPENEDLETACAQPGCTGTIVDGYCDVCASPVSPARLLSAGAPVSADAAMDYRTRVEEAQLPDDVHKAALSEIGKLERINDQSSESDEIRAWLDTILDLPWSTKITDSIDIQGSRDVEATLRKLIEPAVADVDEADAGEVEPAVADVDEADTAEVEPAVADVDEADTAEVEPAVTDVEAADLAPTGRDDDDTVRIPGLPAAHNEGQRLGTGLPEEQVPRREPVQIPAQKRRLGFLALAAITVIALLITALLFAASRDGDVVAQSFSTVTPTATATATKPTSELSKESTDTGGGKSTIRLRDWAHSARAFETVRIQGKYPGGAETLLRVQRWEGDKWVAFPVPAKTDQSGKFTAYVEFEQPGRYKLRVLQPGTGVMSKTFVIVIKG